MIWSSCFTSALWCACLWMTHLLLGAECLVRECDTPAFLGLPHPTIWGKGCWGCIILSSSVLRIEPLSGQKEASTSWPLWMELASAVGIWRQGEKRSWNKSPLTGSWRRDLRSLCSWLHQCGVEFPSPWAGREEERGRNGSRFKYHRLTFLTKF